LRQVGIDVVAAEPRGNSHKKRLVRMINLKLTEQQPLAEPEPEAAPMLERESVEPEPIKVPKLEEMVAAAECQAELDMAADYYKPMFPRPPLRQRFDVTGWKFGDDNQPATEPDKPLVGRTIRTDEDLDWFVEEVKDWWHEEVKDWWH
jgi:hypothetical protein